MTVPSTGDTLMLEQVAWKIGRAFTAGRKDAPMEFREIETQIYDLARALKQLAEALHAETAETLLHEVDLEIRDGVGTILSSCRRTINELDSLVDEYQVIKKHRTVGGFAIERSWSDVILVDDGTVMWTAGGGNLDNLRELLQLHTSSIRLLEQALQSQSQSQLESIIAPLADRIDRVYLTNGDLDQQIEEVHRIVQDMTVSIPTTNTPPPAIPARNPARPPSGEVLNPTNSFLVSSSPPSSPPRRQNTVTPLPRTSRPPRSPDQPTSPSPSISIRAPFSPTETTSTSRTSSPTQKRVSEFSFSASSLRYSSSSYASSTASSGGWSEPHVSRSTSTKKSTPLPRTPEVREPGDRSSDVTLALLPPPAMGLAAPYEVDRMTPRSNLSPYPSSPPELTKLHRSSTTSSQKANFEKEAFRNSAVLCDVRGTLVEYSHRINEDDPRDVEMVTACEDCRITVVRKRVHDPETKSVRMITSIWAFSDDNTVRVELKMDDRQMYIPYSSYFSPAKVSITVPCELKFHDVKLGNRPAKLTKTSWVNYVFDTSQAAALFQNELMGRTLLATFRTEKTMRIHEGLGAAFTYAEQMCALENLRVWEDNDTGAIIGLIHFSAEFRAGYLAFYLNSSVNPIKVKDDGSREVKIKGLRVPIDRGDKAMRKDSVVAASDKSKGKEGEMKRVDSKKVISGAKIEFATDREKQEFLAMCKEVQKELIELPDLLGVN